VAGKKSERTGRLSRNGRTGGKGNVEERNEKWRDLRQRRGEGGRRSRRKEASIRCLVRPGRARGKEKEGGTNISQDKKNREGGAAGGHREG